MAGDQATNMQDPNAHTATATYEVKIGAPGWLAVRMITNR